MRRKLKIHSNNGMAKWLAVFNCTYCWIVELNSTKGCKLEMNLSRVCKCWYRRFKDLLLKHHNYCHLTNRNNVHSIFDFLIGRHELVYLRILWISSHFLGVEWFFICLPSPSEFIWSFCHSAWVLRQNDQNWKTSSFECYFPATVGRPFRLASMAYISPRFARTRISLPWTVCWRPTVCQRAICCCSLCFCCCCYMFSSNISKQTNKQLNINDSVHFQFFAFPFHTPNSDRQKLCSWNVDEAYEKERKR